MRTSTLAWAAFACFGTFALLACGGDADVQCYEDGDEVFCIEKHSSAISETDLDPTRAGSCPHGGGGGGIGAQKPDLDALLGGDGQDISHLQRLLAEKWCSILGGRSPFCSGGGGFTLAPTPAPPTGSTGDNADGTGGSTSGSTSDSDN